MKNICLLTSFSLLIFGCKPHQTITQSSNTTKSEKLPLSYGEQRKLDVNFSEGIIQKMQGNYPEAIDKFKKCLDVYPNHSASMYEIAFISNGAGKSVDAIPYAQKAVSLDGNNEWYRLLLAKCFRSKVLSKRLNPPSFQSGKRRWLHVLENFGWKIPKLF